MIQRNEGTCPAQQLVTRRNGMEPSNLMPEHFEIHKAHLDTGERWKGILSQLMRREADLCSFPRLHIAEQSICILIRPTKEFQLRPNQRVWIRGNTQAPSFCQHKVTRTGFTFLHQQNTWSNYYLKKKKRLGEIKITKCWIFNPWIETDSWGKPKQNDQHEEWEKRHSEGLANAPRWMLCMSKRCLCYSPCGCNKSVQLKQFIFKYLLVLFYEFLCVYGF